MSDMKMKAFHGKWSTTLSTLEGDKDAFKAMLPIPEGAQIPEEMKNKKQIVTINVQSPTLVTITNAFGEMEKSHDHTLGEAFDVTLPNENIVQFTTTFEDDKLKTNIKGMVDVSIERSVCDGKMFVKISVGGKTCTATYHREA